MKMLSGVLIAILATGLAACGGADSGAVTLREFAIEVGGGLPSGPATLSVTNEGEYPHSLVVSDSDGTVIATSGVVEAGEQSALDVDLRAGEYAFACRIVVEDPESGTIVDHYTEGMATEVIVTG